MRSREEIEELIGAMPSPETQQTAAILGSLGVLLDIRELLLNQHTP